MKWSLRIAKISGIDIYLHWTFLILLAWMGFGTLSNLESGTGMGQFGLVLLLFLFVLLHELGHALTGQRFGVKTAHITLLPIGGVASMERMPEKPWQEFWIAIAGPAVNLAIALLIGGVLLLSGQWDPSTIRTDYDPGNFAGNLLAVNLVLFLFNLIPAFPMDGGRILRALLSLRFDRAKATQIAARIGQVLAICFVFIGLYSNVWLVFIGIFIYLGAGTEANYEGTHSILAKYKVRDALMHRHTVLQSHQTLREAIQLLLDGQEKEFLVAAEGNVMGAITRDELIAGLHRAGMDSPLADIANRGLLHLHPDQPLEEVFLQMSNQKLEICPVYEEGALIGVLNRENVIELLMIARAGAGSL